MKFSIKLKFGILLIIFIFIMGMIKVATSWMNAEQRDYALIINLAGKQRMLTQKMTKESLAIAREREALNKHFGDADDLAALKAIYSNYYTKGEAFDRELYTSGYESEGLTTIRQISSRPLDAENAPDEFERSALEALKENEEDLEYYYSVVEQQGRKYLRVLKPLYASSSCIKCHDSYKKDELIGAISIKAPVYVSADNARSSLASSVELFDATLTTFVNGGVLKSEDGHEVLLAPTQDASLKEIIAKSQKLWKEFYSNIKTIMKTGSSIETDDFDAAMSFIVSKSPVLLSLMDDITMAYQIEAEDKIALMDWYQLFFIVFIFAGALFAFVIFTRMIIMPLDKVSEVLSAVSRGDLSKEATDVASNDEIGDMVRALNKMVSNLRALSKDVHSTTDEVRIFTTEVRTVTSDLSTSAINQTSSIKKASGTMERMSTSIGEIAENTESLSRTSDEVSSSTLEITASIDEVAKLSEDLAYTVEEVSSSITQMAYSVKEITTHASQLSIQTNDTATAITQINASIKEVEKNLKTSANLSETTAADAATGRDAVVKTGEAMTKISETVEDVAGVIKRLVDKSMSIGNILNVINEMSEQTNLLSLNAAIIAAQAGEQGRSFAVVADEIKDFSDRTAASTKQIEKLIKSVQSEATNAAKTVDNVGRSVESGTVLSKQAEQALDKILKSASTSSEMVEHIARASAEQLKGSQQVAGAMEKITEMLAKVYRAIEDQEKGSSYIAKATEKMMDSATQTRKATKEQSSGGEHISRGVENISIMLNSINRATQEQADGAKSVLATIEEVSGSTEKNAQNIKRMRDAIEKLQNRSEALSETMKKFH